MNKWLPFGLYGIGSVDVLVACGALFGTTLAERKRERIFELPSLPSLTPRSDTAALERGQYLFASRGCLERHGNHGAGRVFIDDGTA